MGAWGSESCSNDKVWDHLRAENIHKMTQAEADASLKLAFGRGDSHADPKYGVDVPLGVVVWVLRHGLKVSARKLSQALARAKHQLAYMKRTDMGWRDTAERVAELERELVDIRHALDHDGAIRPRHVPGLLEKMAVACAG